MARNGGCMCVGAIPPPPHTHTATTATTTEPQPQPGNQPTNSPVHPRALQAEQGAEADRGPLRMLLAAVGAPAVPGEGPDGGLVGPGHLRHVCGCGCGCFFFPLSFCCCCCLRGGDGVDLWGRQ